MGAYFAHLYYSKNVPGERILTKKGKGILNSLNVPWITRDGDLDFSKFPMDSVLKQSLSADEEKFRVFLSCARIHVSRRQNRGRCVSLWFVYPMS